MKGGMYRLNDGIYERKNEDGVWEAAELTEGEKLQFDALHQASEAQQAEQDKAAAAQTSQQDQAASHNEAAVEEAPAADSDQVNTEEDA